MSNLHAEFKCFNVKKIKVSEKENEGTRWMEIEIISDDGDRGSITLFHDEALIEIEGLEWMHQRLGS